jgi:hypothetical protein
MAWNIDIANVSYVGKLAIRIPTDNIKKFKGIQIA